MGPQDQAEPVSEPQVQAEPVSEPQVPADVFEDAASMWTPERQAEAEAGLDIFGQPAVASKRTFYEQDTDADFTPRTGEEAAEPVATPSLEDDSSPIPSPLTSWKTTEPVAAPKDVRGLMDSSSPLPSPRSRKVK